MKNFLLPIAALCLSCGPVLAEGKPNIVIILADDLGAESLGCYGGVHYKGLGPAKTPNLDAMAKAGMRFTHCFATPVCSPARAELLTGKYNFRTGFTDITGRNGATSSLDSQAHPTVAACLKEAGYVTAVAGKWHLGPPENMGEIPKTPDADTGYPHPRECGFDRQCILGGAHLRIYGDPKRGIYTPDIMQKWVLNFLESRKGKEEPFFLYYPSPIPHDPFLPTPLNPDGSQQDKRGDNANYPFLIEYLDAQVGEVLKKLAELGLSDKTVVLFTADNGTNKKISTEMSDGRIIPGGKGSLLDTGSRVPLLAGWPGRIMPGSVNNNLVDFSDLLPTFLDLAGAPLPDGLDGVSFASQLLGKPGRVRDWVHTLIVDKYFVRDSKWKLRENGVLYDVSNAPYAETPIPPHEDSPESKAARSRLQGIVDKLHSKNPQ